MLICSFSHTQAFSYQSARVRIEKDEARGRSTPIVCRNCKKAPCIEACPVEAISRLEPEGYVVLKEAECVGCGECVSACPFGAIRLDKEKGIALKCDLCGGDPQCVRVCRFPQALSWR
jgi:Fe-S-cluster-containing hydrogenase component 2